MKAVTEEPQEPSTYIPSSFLWVASIPSDRGVEVMWQNARDFSIISRLFTRLVLGVAFGDSISILCLGERVYNTPRGNYRVFIALEDFESPHSEQAVQGLIRLKDQYRCRQIFCDSRPQHFVESLRNTEGLSWYGRDRSEADCERVWPSFVDKNTVGGVIECEMPDPKAMHRDIEAWIEAKPVNPQTGKPLITSNDIPLPAVNFPLDLPVKRLQAAIRMGTDGMCRAFWHCMMALRRPSNLEVNRATEFFRQGNYITGY